MGSLRVAEKVVVAGLLHLLGQRLCYHLHLELTGRVPLVALAVATARQLQRKTRIVLWELLGHRRVVGRSAPHPREEEEAVLCRWWALVQAHEQALVLHRFHLIGSLFQARLHRVWTAPNALELIHWVELHPVARLNAVVLEQQLCTIDPRAKPEAIEENELLVVILALQRFPPVFGVELQHFAHQDLVRLVNGVSVVHPSQLHLQLQGLWMVEAKHHPLWLPLDRLVNLLLGGRPPPLLRLPEL
mmetsp:Transcript_86750/g.258879  ORF Transcript_86750/g.258879 Transcript_86750/m.258879 type:complete len:245 (+) Transcript_86750:579-1313(+)